MKKISFGIFVIVLVAAIILPVNALYVACYNGTDATLGINWTFTGAPGTLALVSNVGTPSAVLLDFTIPAGADGGMNQTPGATGAQGIPGINGTNGSAGAQGIPGTNGTNGLAASIAINATFTGAAGSAASVSNIGNTSVASFDFTIPKGYNGTDGSATDLTGFPFLNGSRTYQGNLDIGNNHITNLSTGNTGDTATNKTYVDAVNTSMKNYVDAAGSSNYNASYNNLIRTDYVYTNNTTYVQTNNGSYILGTNTTYALDSEVSAVNDTMRNYVNATNTSMKNYVDGLGTSNYNASYNALIRTDYVYTDNTSYVKTNNGSYVLTSNGSYILGTNTSYVLTSNGSYVLTSNGSYILGTNTSYFLVNGSRAMTGNLSMGSNYINNIITGNLGTDAVNKSYVDGRSGDTAGGADKQVIYNAGGVETGNASFTFENTTGTVTATAFVGDGSGLTGIGSTAATALTFDAKACGVALKKGQAVYISGASGSNPLVCQADNTDTAKSRVVGLVIADVNANAQAKVRRAGTLVTIDTRSTNANINPLAQTWAAGDLLFATTGGGLTNVRPTSGRSVKVAYSMEGSSIGDTLLAYPMENPVWLTAASGESVVTRLGDNTGTNKLSIRNYSNAEVAYVNSQGLAAFNGTTLTNNLTMSNKYITGLMSGTLGSDGVNKSYVDSMSSNYNASYVTTDNTSYVKTNNGSYILGTNTSYVLTNNGSYILGTNTSYVKTSNTSYVQTSNNSYVLGTNTTHVVNPVFGYATLMAGSAMVATTNATTMSQTETSTNKNNYISVDFTDGGVETAQWIMDFPADWNTSANVIFTPVWTATSSTGGINLTVKARTFTNDAALDTALVTIGNSVDTLLSASDVHVAPDTTGVAITGGGNTAIISVNRNSAAADDTLGATVQLIGLRVKYVRSLA